MFLKITNWFKGLFGIKAGGMLAGELQGVAPTPLPVALTVASTLSTPAPATTPAIHGSLEWYGYLFDEAELTTSPMKLQALTACCDKILENKERYERVSNVTGVPWYFIGAIHYRESSLNFTRYLGNGDPLNQKSTHVPAGRGPFPSWELGADDALRFAGLAGRTDWTVPMILQMAEHYNGTGYLKYHPTVNSPYIWSYTNQYNKGKYGSDGHFDAELVDGQIGIAAIIKELKARKVI